MINTSYTPNTPKGNRILAKVNFSTSERLGAKDNGVSLHITVNSDYNWFCTLTENQNGIDLEFHTGEHQFMIEQTLKPIQQNNVFVLKATIQK